MKSKSILTKLLPAIAGIAVFTALTAVCAYLIHSSAVPMEQMKATALVSLAIASFTAGALSGEAKSGAITGSMFCALYLMHRLIASDGGLFDPETAIGGVICLICPIAVSCILHKKRKPYTKRNRPKSKRK